MKVFCDTSILVAALVTNHPHHHAARPVLEKIKAATDEGFVAAHSLAECYAVLTRLPGMSHASPGTAWQLISENIIKNFRVISLSPREYARTLEDCAILNVQGGKVYDALLIGVAIKSRATRIYTFNVSHFQSLVSENVKSLIVAP